MKPSAIRLIAGRKTASYLETRWPGTGTGVEAAAGTLCPADPAREDGDGDGGGVYARERRGCVAGWGEASAVRLRYGAAAAAGVDGGRGRWGVGWKGGREESPRLGGKCAREAKHRAAILVSTLQAFSLFFFFFFCEGKAPGSGKYEHL